MNAQSNPKKLVAMDIENRVTYFARAIGRIEYKPGAWQGLRVGVFRSDGESEQQVGEYERNHPDLYRTFYHFKKNGQDYALYSCDYTATRVMELPSCKDIGGEEPDGDGFCPVDFYVPRYIESEYLDVEDKPHRIRINEPGDDDLTRRTTKWTPLDPKTGERIVVEKPSYPVGPLTYYPFGFVAGCIWADDRSWKIQYLDLSEVERGVIKRDARFGYIEMPHSMNLKDAISMSNYAKDPAKDWSHRITIAIQQHFDLRTGSVVDVDPFK